MMKDNFMIAKDDLYDEDLLLGNPHFMDLDPDDNFTLNDDEEDSESVLNDEEFEKLLQEIIDEESSDEKQEPTDILTLDEERNLFEIEKKLAYERIRLEREELEYEKEKFARAKSEWEALKKLSEESFQAEKAEYEKQKELDRERLYLETKEIVNSCANFREFFEDYKKIHDVSE